jgi:hypothetical protein
MPYGVQTSQTGWRLPNNLIEQVLEAAHAERTRPGAYVARILEREFAKPHQNEPLSAQELLARVKFPQGF